MPRGGTLGRVIYDFHRAGLTSAQIATRIRRTRAHVSVVLSQLKPSAPQSKARALLDPEDVEARAMLRRQRISEGVRRAYAEGTLGSRGPRYSGPSFSEAHKLARQVEGYWHKLGYRDVVCVVVDDGEVRGRRVYRVSSNLVNGVPPARQLVAAE